MALFIPKNFRYALFQPCVLLLKRFDCTLEQKHIGGFPSWDRQRVRWLLLVSHDEGLMKPRRHIPKRSYVVKAALRSSTETKKDCVWNFFGAGGLYLPALGYSNAGGRPRWAHPPVTRRVSELERPQCNCPVLGPFLYGDAP